MWGIEARRDVRSAALTAFVLMLMLAAATLLGGSAAAQQDPVAEISLIHSVSEATDECVTVAKNLNSLVAGPEGLPITWCLQVTNTGNVPLTNVFVQAPEISAEVIDPLAPLGSIALLPGESVFIPVAGTVPNQGLISAAGVSADPSDELGGLLVELESVRDFDNAAALEASLELDVTGVVGPNGDCVDASALVEVLIWQTVTWCYEVANTGSSVLRVTAVEDAAFGITIPVPSADQRLSLADSFQVSIDVVTDYPVLIAGGPQGAVRGVVLDFSDQPLDLAVSATGAAGFRIAGYLGDVDCSRGLPTVRDALLIAQYVLGTAVGGSCPLTALNQLDLSVADMTADELITNDDVQELLELTAAPALVATN